MAYLMAWMSRCSFTQREGEKATKWYCGQSKSPALQSAPHLLPPAQIPTAPPNLPAQHSQRSSSQCQVLGTRSRGSSRNASLGIQSTHQKTSSPLQTSPMNTEVGVWSTPDPVAARSTGSDAHRHPRQRHAWERISNSQLRNVVPVGP